MKKEYTSDKLFIVSEDEMMRLLNSYNILLALEAGGVDDWDWYGCSLSNFLKIFIDQHPEVCDIEDIDYNIIAMYDMANYRTLDELITDTKWEIED